MEVFFSHFSDTPASESYFLSSGNVFLNKFFIPYGGEPFSCGNRFLLFNLFILQVEAVTEINCPFFGKN